MMQAMFNRANCHERFIAKGPPLCRPGLKSSPSISATAVDASCAAVMMCCNSSARSCLETGGDTRQGWWTLSTYGYGKLGGCFFRVSFGDFCLENNNIKTSPLPDSEAQFLLGLLTLRLQHFSQSLNALGFTWDTSSVAGPYKKWA